MILTRAILFNPSATPRLFPGNIARPQPGHGELLVRVKAAGVNPADIEQSRGAYPPPPGASPILGLEVAGEVVAVGSGTSRFRPGDRVMALVSGGGYAEYCVANEATVLPIPDCLTYLEAAALPEAMFTVWANVVDLGRLQQGETLLVQGGTGGVGSMAVRIGKLRGAKVIATAGSDIKCEAARCLGADLAVNYHQDDLVVTCEDFGGVDVILDSIGAKYLARHLQVLKSDGRLVLVDCRSGEVSSLDLGMVMTKQLTVTGSLLRPRSMNEKSRIRLAIESELSSHLIAGQLRPLVDQTFPLERAQDAHDRLEAGITMGKLVLEVNHDEC